MFQYQNRNETKTLYNDAFFKRTRDNINPVSLRGRQKKMMWLYEQTLFLSSKQIYLPRKRLENTKIECINYIGDEEDDDAGREILL